MDANYEFQNIVINEFDRRRVSDPKYSLRAFSRDLGLHPGAVSQIIQRKRRVSWEMASKILADFNLEESEFTCLKKIFFSESYVVDPTSPAPEVLKLSEDQARLLSEWQYFAIMSLCECDHKPASISEICKRFGLLENEVEPAVNRLSRMGLVQFTGGRFKTTVHYVTTTEDVSSRAIQYGQFDNLRLTKKALKELECSEREFTCLTIPTSHQKLDKAKTLIREFRNRFMEIMEDGEKEDVYRLSIQYFPLTQKVNRP